MDSTDKPGEGGSRGTHKVLVALLFLAAIYTLYFASTLLIPLVLAALLALPLYPLVQYLRRFYIPRAGAQVFGHYSPYGNFWLASYGEGVYYKNENHLYNVNTDDGLLGDDIYVMKTDKLGRIWVGTDGGISICEIRNKEKIIKNLTRDDGLPDEIVREILEDDDGNFWIGTYDKGVCFYDFEKEKFEYPLPNWDNGIVSKLEIFKDRELWIGTEGNGIWLLSLLDGTLQKLSNQNQLSGSKIHDLHKDIEGNIWVISNLHGICHANRQFEFIPITTGADFENIQSILADRGNKVWVGTEKGLFTHELDELGNSFFTQHLKNHSLNVISLYEDNFENIWIGTFGDGVYIFNKRTLWFNR